MLYKHHSIGQLCIQLNTTVHFNFHTTFNMFEENKKCLCHDIAELLLKLVSNNNLSTSCIKGVMQLQFILNID